MVQQDYGRFGSASRGKTGIIYVPADLVKDTTFPFAEGDPLLIQIDGKRLMIEKSKHSEVGKVAATRR
jgi:hypothetical protein